MDPVVERVRPRQFDVGEEFEILRYRGSCCGVASWCGGLHHECRFLAAWLARNGIGQSGRRLTGRALGPFGGRFASLCLGAVRASRR